MPRMTPGLVIAAPGSGAGKTTVTLGLLRALRDRALVVQPFKCGPDYIDPAFHHIAVGRASLNLDSWAMSRSAIRRGVARACESADIAIAEGAMGLFDGAVAPGVSGNGSAADIAAATGWPVVLILDTSSQAQSAAAVAHGFASYRPDVTLAAVILNKVASPRHETLLRAGFQSIGIDVLGSLPRNSQVSLPSRHLGLVQAQELATLEKQLVTLGKMADEHCKLDTLLRLAAKTNRIANADTVAAAGFPASTGATAARLVHRSCSIGRSKESFDPPPGQHIAIARDAAFSFLYPHLLAAWQSAGATLSFFSPLANEGPDQRADVCWLPGGYPELHCERLAKAHRFRDGMRAFAQNHSVHGECGGYMVMGAGLVDADGRRHEMLGLLGLETSFAQRQRHLGYRRARLLHDMPGYAAGSILRGHEFHRCSIVSQPDASLAEISDAAGELINETGAWRRGQAGNTLSGSFFHLLAQDPATSPA